jgi:hypothetical protein
MGALQGGLWMNREHRERGWRMPSDEKLRRAKRAFRKKMSKRKPTPSLSTADPFRLEGRDLSRSHLAEDEILSWYAEMRNTLSERWAVVAHHHREASLAAELGKKIGKAVSPQEAERWFRDARQDHKWRVRLLNPRTTEGRLYLAYSHLTLEHEYFRPDDSKLPQIKELVLFLLDLEEVPYPFAGPLLREHVVKPGDTEMRPHAQWEKRGMFMFLPMEGLRIPRRYGKVRACEALTQFLHSRSEEYWNDALHYLTSVVTEILRSRGIKKGTDRELLKNHFGEASMGLVSALRAPQLKLSRSIEPRGSVMTTEEEAKARVLYKKWYHHVRRLVRLPARERTASAPSAEFARLFNEAYEDAHETARQPQRIALQMVIWDLELPVSIDTLRKKVARKHRRPRKST